MLRHGITSLKEMCQSCRPFGLCLGFLAEYGMRALFAHKNGFPFSYGNFVIAKDF